MSNLNELTQAANMGDFDAIIEDGKMIITPSDAGIQLFGYVAMSEQQIERAELEAETAQEIIENLRQDNASLRDLLERVYGVLTEAGQLELAKEVIDTCYPITGTLEDGTVVEIDG